MEGEEEQRPSRLTVLTGGVDQNTGNPCRRRALLALNCLLLTIGTCGGPLIARLYFVNGGHRIWLSCLLQTVGFPIILLPLAVSAFLRRPGPAIQIKPFLFTMSAIIGILSGLNNYIYSYGLARLPVSTSSLILASQLAFTAVFAFLLVRQRFTPFSINSVVLLTAGGCVLALRSGGDRPEGVNTRQYVAGFVMTLLAAGLAGFILPLMELCYKKGKQRMTYSLVLEIQVVLCFFATAFAAVGMIVNNDFQVIPREAREFELGEFKYYMILVWSAIIWQGYFLGSIGVIFCSSSLVSAVFIAVLLPGTQVLGVILFKEKFQAEKGVSLALSLWGFVSYFYGEMIKTHGKPEAEITPLRSNAVRDVEIQSPTR